MVCVSASLGEKEIIFPEMVAITIGLWIVNKRVWKVYRWQIVLLMTLGAVAGMCIVRYSPLPDLYNLCLAFIFAGSCLLISRSTLIPLISACMLPVLLHTESWVYPLTVFALSLTGVLVQKCMEYYGVRQSFNFTPPERVWRKDLVRWLWLLCFVFLIGSLALWTDSPYLIIPPLVVTFVEMVNSKSGFRARPVQVFLFLVTGASVGTYAQIWGFHYLHLPEGVVASFIILCLFAIFEWTGKYFAPAGALAFIPLVVRQDLLPWLPLQATIGAALFIAIAMLFFQKCYKWDKARLAYCFTPTLLREHLNHRKASIKSRTQTLSQK